MLANILSKVLNADDTLENLLHHKTTANTTTPLYFYFNSSSSGRQATWWYAKKRKDACLLQFYNSLRSSNVSSGLNPDDVIENLLPSETTAK